MAKKEIKARTAEIAGREYTLRYAIEDRRTLDRELGKGLWQAITGGLFEDQLTILLHGLKDKYPTLGRAKLVKLLQEHVDAGGAIDRPIRAAFWAVIDAGLVGALRDADAFRAVCPDPDEEPAVTAEDEEAPPVGGKAAGPRAVAGPSGY